MVTKKNTWQDWIRKNLLSAIIGGVLVTIFGFMLNRINDIYKQYIISNTINQEQNDRLKRIEDWLDSFRSYYFRAEKDTVK
jgi:hypothetical protein